MPSCYKIFEWWSDKYITEDGDISCNKGLKVVANNYFASCWACGKAVKREDIAGWDKYDVPLKELWSDKRVNSVLQKAHIIAKQFGGEAKPENLFLLCADCHYESPDTKNYAAFLRWVYRRRQKFAYGIDVDSFYQEMVGEIKARGYDAMSFLKEYYDVGYKMSYDVVDEAFKASGLHGTSIAPSSVSICLVDEMERCVLKSSPKAIPAGEKELSREDDVQVQMEM